MKLRISKIEERYGTALFQLVWQENQLNDVIIGVRRLHQFFTEYHTLWYNVTHPGISIFSQQQMILKICDLLKLGTFLRNFLLLLSKNRRLSLAENIFNFFEVIYRKKQGIKEGFITSTETISPENILELQSQLEKLLNQKIELRTSKNESLLGGFIFRIDNYLFDFSLKTRLFKIKQAMKG